MEHNSTMNLPLVKNNGNIANSREELEKALCQYMLNTKNLVDTVTVFFEGISKWKEEREREIKAMEDIKERQNKSLWNRLFSGCETLEEELATVLQSTQIGLEELTCFLEAVEMLAVTSPYIFEESDQVMQVCTGIHLDVVQATINASWQACPLLFMFKRDHEAFFHPSLDNVEVMKFQLEKYISITNMIYTIFKGVEENLISGFWQMNQEITAKLAEDLSKDDIQSFLLYVNQLVCIRADKDFRLVFLFQKMSTFDFMDEFSKRKPTMLQFLDDLEGNAVQLDRLKKATQISSVAGSSVGAVGGVATIAGLVLIPFTAGASAWLTMAGLGLGATSTVNSAVTTGVEIFISRNENQKASEVFKNFMEDVKVLQDYLEEVSCQAHGADESEMAEEGFTMVNTVGKGMHSIIVASTVQSNHLLPNVGNAAISSSDQVLNKLCRRAKPWAPRGFHHRLPRCHGHRVSRAAFDIPEAGQAAAKGSLAVSKAARAGLIAFNGLFLGLDLFYIYKDSVNLANGSKCDHSRFIRSRAALWRSEVDSMQKLYDSLCKGVQESHQKLSVLETPFQPLEKDV